jgi:aminoglycoside 6'-N-acetyltransferase
VTTELVGAGARLRPYDPADLPALVHIVNHPEVAAWWGAHDESELREALADESLTVWTIVVDGEPAGLVQVSEERSRLPPCEPVGFKPVGIMRRAERAPDGRWRDGLLMELLAEELR